MPPLSTVVIRLALVHLGLGVAAGGWLLTARGFPSLPTWPWLQPIHLEVALLGWTLQLAMGVAYWILPKFPTQPERGRHAPVVVAFGLLNLGILLAAAGAVVAADGLLLAGRLAEAGGLALFATNAWPRVKAFGA